MRTLLKIEALLEKPIKKNTTCNLKCVYICYTFLSHKEKVIWGFASCAHLLAHLLSYLVSYILCIVVLSQHFSGVFKIIQLVFIRSSDADTRTSSTCYSPMTANIKYSITIME